MKFGSTFLASSLVLISSAAVVTNAVAETVTESVAEENPQFYIGGGYGQYSIKWDKEDTEFDEDSGVLKAFAGVQFNKYLGGEISYLNFDEVNDFDSNASIDGVSFAGTLSAPLHEKVSLYAKGGWFEWNAEIKTTIPLIGEVSRESDGGDWFYGAGIKLGLAERLDLRIEYERYELEENIDPELDVASVSLQYSF